jgi:hypothetical protein
MSGWVELAEELANDPEELLAWSRRAVDFVLSLPPKQAKAKKKAPAKKAPTAAKAPTKKAPTKKASAQKALAKKKR